MRVAGAMQSIAFGSSGRVLWDMGPPVKGRRAHRITCDAGRMNEQAAGPMNEQDAPIEAGAADATLVEKLEGIAEQIRGDAELGHVDDVRRMARQRLEEANLPTDDATVDAVVTAVGST